jgi:hypothetical protein
MTIDKKTLIMEGVTLHCGLLNAITWLEEFDIKYKAKHNSCLENVIYNGLKSVADYIKKEENTFERYMLMRVYNYDKQTFGKAKDDRFP